MSKKIRGEGQPHSEHVEQKRKEFTRDEFEAHVGKNLNFEVKGDGLMLATSFDETDSLEKKQGKEKKPFEWFQVFDEHDEPIVVDGHELVLYRKECHGPERIQGVFHRGVNIFVVNSKNELLVPVRSDSKDLYPSHGDVSVSEHVNVREGYLDAAIRGFQEEQGVDIDPKDLKLIKKGPVENNDQSEMCEYYVYVDDGKAYEISDETASQEWVSIDSLRGVDIKKKLHFRDDHFPALESFLSSQ